MNPKSILVLVVVVMAGALGGAAAYQFAVPASSADPVARESLVIDRADRGANQKARKPGFAPCRKPAKPEGDKCVTDVVRTVVVPGSSGTAPARSSAPAPVPVDSSDHNDDESRHHGGEGEEGHHGDDDDDDDDGGHHGDDDTHTDTRSTVSADTGTSTRTRSHD